MKNIASIAVMYLLAATIYAQTPQAFKYQAVARDNAGNLIANQNVSFRISILQGSTAGNAVYVETHSALTNQFGLVNLEIGSGTVVSGIFANILWRSGLYFLQIEMDAAGGTNYQLMGTTQLVSVPYSFYSVISGGLVLTDENGDLNVVGVDEDGNLTTTLINQWQACGDLLTDVRNRQKYETVLIGSQCWMAQNLNIGNMINETWDQTDNSTIEKYCKYDNEVNCDNFGGLYQWDEAIQYINTEKSKGICPEGWHVPSDNELCIMTVYIDPTVNCNAGSWNGNDVGTKMKSISGWYNDGDGTNTSGFNALAAGYIPFGNFGDVARFWSSTEYNSSTAWERSLSYTESGIERNNFDKNWGFSLRCLKDYNNLPPASPFSPTPTDGAMNICLDPDLSWVCSDPDGNDLYYEVYFGTNPSPPFVVAGLTAATYDPGTLIYNTTYYWKIIAFDSYGDTAVSNVWSFTTLPVPVWACGDVLVDERDAQTYNTMQIGTQCWMAENMNIGNMIYGNTNQQNNPQIEKYCYNNNTSNCNTYGGLYQWNEMMQYNYSLPAQGICPTGWHLPTDGEWCTITQYIDPTVNCSSTAWSGTDAGTKMKTTSGWSSGNGTNTSGFTAIPGGYNSYTGTFSSLLMDAYFWSSSAYNSSESWIRRLSSYENNVFRNYMYKNYGYSVRCVKNN